MTPLIRYPFPAMLDEHEAAIEAECVPLKTMFPPPVAADMKGAGLWNDSKHAIQGLMPLSLSLADLITAFGPDSGFTTEQLIAGLTVPATKEEPT
jgi:hypothetical protein